MDKIRSLFQKIPVKAAFYICVSAFALLAAALSFFTCKTAREKLFDIESNYSVRLSDSSYSEGDSVIYYNLNLNGAELSPQDKRAFDFYNALNDFAPVFWSLACLICSAAVFYSLVLKQPLYILKQASANIADRNLDFSIPCSGKNEFSKLCNSFEAMRRSLCENNREMTEMIEQRKRLNDAYTHELRTPAAVLKGCADMILKYFPKGEMPEAELTETVGIMSEHISRIEAFTDSMNTIQKTEDISVSPKSTDMRAFLEIIKSSAGVLCKGCGINLDFQNSVGEKLLCIDKAAVSQVFENLFNNALRFADKNIFVSFSNDGSALTMVISDDGRGFAEKDLKKAAMCRYSGKDSAGNYHFGLGLYISSLLCKKHGGKLLVENSKETGGAKLTAVFDID